MNEPEPVNYVDPVNNLDRLGSVWYSYSNTAWIVNKCGHVISCSTEPMSCYQSDTNVSLLNLPLLSGFFHDESIDNTSPCKAYWSVSCTLDHMCSKWPFTLPQGVRSNSSGSNCGRFQTFTYSSSFRICRGVRLLNDYIKTAEFDFSEF